MMRQFHFVIQSLDYFHMQMQESYSYTWELQQVSRNWDYQLEILQ